MLTGAWSFDEGKWILKQCYAILFNSRSNNSYNVYVDVCLGGYSG